MKTNRFEQKKSKSQEMSLNITAMADIFTILLVFLLRSAGSAGANTPPATALQLPAAKGGSKPVELVRMEVSPREVLLDGKAVLHLRNFEFPSAEIEPNGSSRSLNATFASLRQRQLASVGVTNAASAEGKVEKRLMVLLDRNTPYDAIKVVLSSAASQGYTDFQLAVVTEEE